MPDIYCEWNNDLQITPSGGLVTASGWDRVRQRIIRHLITNSSSRLPDGTFTAPDYIFHKEFGIGAGSLVGQNPTPAFQADLIARINQAVLSDVAVDPGALPTVIFKNPQPGTWIVYISVKLRDQTVGRTAIRIS